MRKQPTHLRETPYAGPDQAISYGVSGGFLYIGGRLCMIAQMTSSGLKGLARGLSRVSSWGTKLL